MLARLAPCPNPSNKASLVARLLLSIDILFKRTLDKGPGLGGVFRRSSGTNVLEGAEV